MSVKPTPSTPTSSAPGGNMYVGPSLASSLFHVAAALATAQRQAAPQR